MHSLSQLLALLLVLFCFNLLKTQDLRNCSLTDCPANAQCTISAEGAQCLCVNGFVLNADWQQQNATNATQYCIDANNTATASDKIVMYVRSPAQVGHLVFGILLVLLAATLAVSVMFLLTVLRPLKRTRNAYMMLKRRRQNHMRLEEFGDIDMPTIKRGSDTELYTIG